MGGGGDLRIISASASARDRANASTRDTTSTSTRDRASASARDRHTVNPINNGVIPIFDHLVFAIARTSARAISSIDMTLNSTEKKRSIL